MKQPEIRFNGFIDEWSASVLGDVLKIPAKIEAKVKSNSDLLTVKLHGGGVHQMSSNKLLKLGSTKYYVRKAGQLIYGKQNFFNGSMAIIPLELDGKASSGDVPVFDITGADSIFLYQKISQPSFYERTKDLASGTGSKRLHEKTVQRLPIQLPTLPEQQKIGALFSKYDAIISLREQKLAELNALKKGMLQQMFDDGSAISHKPQVRFSGFNDEWVEKKLGEITERFDSNRKAVAATKRIKGDIPYYGAVGVQGYIDGYTHDGEYLLIAEDGASSMLDYPVRVTSGKIWVNNHAHVLAGLSNVADNKYLRNKLMTIDMTPYITGGSRHKLTAGDLDTIKIQLPTFSEQQKIGQLFKHLDARISNEQSKIEQLKAQKQGLLQKMLS